MNDFATMFDIYLQGRVNVCVSGLLDRVAALETRLSDTTDKAPMIFENLDQRINKVECELDFGTGPTEPTTLWDQVQKCMNWINDQRIYDAHEALNDRIQCLEDKFDSISTVTEERIEELISNHIYDNDIPDGSKVSEMIEEGCSVDEDQVRDIVRNLDFEVRVS